MVTQKDRIARISHVSILIRHETTILCGFWPCDRWPDHAGIARFVEWNDVQPESRAVLERLVQDNGVVLRKNPQALLFKSLRVFVKAGEEIRTLDIHVGNVTLYH